ncbi:MULTISPECIES: AIR synthase-related protein [unclassified Aureispira]|uniref:AIR synthase-related protein n=1 Tax=unclassified Aureispira TaxID=2649989 RepID=UPI000696BB35|nr:MULTISPECIES: AIR synthase-related protein [unclassified Aureispira]WMX15441.1 AIR synthase-related protein [Aureispira sp. CCB-E]
MSNQKKSGLDIDLGNLCSKDAFGWAKKTFSNRTNKAGAAALKVDGVFSNMLQFGNQRIGIASDGIGTKIELAERTGIYDTLGFDLVAMVADDLATAGFEPTNISNIIDVDQLDRATINSLMKGLTEACDFCGMSISGGEIAELGNRIGGYGDGMHFNWCSTAIGILPEELEKPFDGTAVQAGDKVIALKGRGFRSNGFSLIRRIMQASFGDAWHNEIYEGETTWGEALLTPSLIFTPVITKMIKAGVALSGVAHITGGGIIDNFQRVLKANGVGADLDNLFEPLPVMKRLMDLGNVAAEDAYLYWNMGNGMLVVAEESQVDKILEITKEQGYQAQIAGTITAERRITLKTASAELEGTY